MLDESSKLINIFENNIFKEEITTTETNNTIKGVRSFCCTEFGEIPKVKTILDAIRKGEFLDSGSARKSDSTEVAFNVNNVCEDKIWLSDGMLVDLHRLCEFEIIDHKGDHIPFRRAYITQPILKESDQNNSTQKEDNIKFLHSIAPVVYTKENQAYAPKFFNIFGKYFHQGGIGVFIKTYLLELGKGIIPKSEVKDNNKVIFDLTKLNEGIIKITEYFEFKAARKIDNPDEVIEREDGKPIAVFSFPFIVQVNPHNDECRIESLPLKMDVMDVNLMRETYMPVLSNINNFTPLAILGKINSTANNGVSCALSLVNNSVSKVNNGLSYVSSLVFNSAAKDEQIDKSHSTDSSSKSDISSNNESNNTGSPISNSSNSSPSSS